MSATLAVFRRWKEAKKIESDRAAMGELGLSHGAAVHWKNGKNGDAHMIERMCSDLGEDPVPVILEAFAEAARDASARKALQRLARRYRGTLAALVVAIVPLLSPAPVGAHSGSTVYPLCERGNATRRRAQDLQRRRSNHRSVTTWTTYRPASRP